MILYLDIYTKIFEYCTIYNQLNIMLIFKLLNKKLKIKKLNHSNVSNTVSQQEKFIYLKELYTNYNEKIKMLII